MQQTDFDWSQCCTNRREESCREERLERIQREDSWGENRKERVAYCWFKLGALRVTPHTTLGVKAGFEITDREKLKICITEDGSTSPSQEKNYVFGRGGKQL